MRIAAGWALAAVLAAPAAAQVRTVDPNNASTMATPRASTPGAQSAAPDPDLAENAPSAPVSPAPAPADPAQPAGTRAPPPASDAERQARADAGNTYAEQDVLGAAEGVFGKGAAGLARLIEKLFREQGRPSAYIAGREAGGAFIVGLRYGSGTLYHKIEGQRPVYWTGPSVGFDFGANGAKEFVLVYNLYDTQELYRRFPAVEGVVYVVGGFTASYLRSGDKVLIPIRLGVGWRLGANIGYMKFTEKSKWMPF